ncbi:MAG TPA: thioredoxin family protein [Longimicrobiales bacterium]|nr:thioredoxin family protein [Longimicrobiales bacterium]
MTTQVQILGTGCPKCRTLTASVEAAIADLGVDAEIVKVDQIKDIVALGVMTPPALAVDGVVKSSGHLLSVEQVKRILTA